MKFKNNRALKVKNFGSSEESVGEIWSWEFSELMKAGDFQCFDGAKSVCRSECHFELVI